MISLRGRWLRLEDRVWWWQFCWRNGVMQDRMARWAAWKLPRRVALHAFVRVAAASGFGPDELTYESMYKAWEEGRGR
jgi:hypothetical protein